MKPSTGSGTLADGEAFDNLLAAAELVEAKAGLNRGVCQVEGEAIDRLRRLV
ncbi:MAG: hypothetical protein AAF490_26070 [Chloroflexota bacterium]